MIKGLVSIVIPVYNTEKFLSDCFLSLENQTYKNIEFIFVNDGSTDNSQKILENFCLKHQNARLINQSNKGLAGTRAVGMSVAKGEFLYNHDPDDMIHPQLIEVFVDAIEKENADFVCGWGRKCRENTTYSISNWKQYSKNNYKIIEGQDLISFISGKNIGSNWSIQVKLYRMSTLKQISSFPQITPKNFSRGEDLRFNADVINYCNKVVLVNHVFHLWRQRKSSLTHIKKFNPKDLNVLNALDPFLNFKPRNKIETKAILGNKAYQASLLLCTMKQCKHYNLNDVEITYKIFKENWKYCLTKKYHRPVVIFAPLQALYWIGFIWKTRRLNKH